MEGAERVVERDRLKLKPPTYQVKSNLPKLKYYQICSMVFVMVFVKNVFIFVIQGDFSRVSFFCRVNLAASEVN